MNLIVVDTETSDLDPAKGATILELAWNVISQTENGWEKTFSHETFIKYVGPISPEAQAVHHIRADQLQSGVPRVEAVGLLLQHLKPDSYFVAHNVEFDS